MTDDEVVDVYERTVDEVHRYASRLTGHDRAAAEELVQDTYLALVRRVRDGAIEHVDIGWLIVTCRSRFLDGIRSHHRRERRERTYLSAAPVPASASNETTDVLAMLPEDQRVALVLRYLDDMSVPEVAHALGRSVRATESLLARGRDNVRRRAAGSNDPRAEEATP